MEIYNYFLLQKGINIPPKTGAHPSKEQFRIANQTNPRGGYYHVQLISINIPPKTGLAGAQHQVRHLVGPKE